jgi:hypothetical protein
MNDKIEITGLQRLLQFAYKDSFGRFIVNLAIILMIPMEKIYR